MTQRCHRGISPLLVAPSRPRSRAALLPSEPSAGSRSAASALAAGKPVPTCGTVPRWLGRFSWMLGSSGSSIGRTATATLGIEISSAAAGFFSFPPCSSCSLASAAADFLRSLAAATRSHEAGGVMFRSATIIGSLNASPQPHGEMTSPMTRSGRKSTIASRWRASLISVSQYSIRAWK